MAKREMSICSIPRKKILDPDGQFITTCRWISMILFSICLFVDPLFFYLPTIDDQNKCPDSDRTLWIVLCVLRSGLDLLYFLFMIPSALIIPQRASGNSSSRIIYRATIITHELQFLLPIPQVQTSDYTYLLASESDAGTLMSLILVFFLMRLTVRIVLNNYLESTTLMPVTSWPVTVNSLYYCILGSHVVGSSWYFLSIDSVLRCWLKELNIGSEYSEIKHLWCRHLNATMVIRLNSSSCVFVDPNEKLFDHGIFTPALASHVLQSSKGFSKRFLYCFWWGLRNISSFGQNLETSTFNGDIIFAISICVCGLVLFTLLVGNIQNYHQSIRKKWKEAEVERYDTEKWMLRKNLPQYLRKRIRLHEQYKWQKTKFVDEEAVLRNLPKEIRRDVKRHLCLPSLTKVPQFETLMDSYLLDALCGRLKPVLYIKKTCILCEGKPIEEMIFIKRGNLKIMAKKGRSPDFSKSSNLKGGDFCGEELVTWALDPNSSSRILPISTRTVKTISKVEAYVLMADDLKLIASQLHAKQLYGSSRLHEEESRTWAASKIQKAWLRYRKSKIERSLSAAEAGPQSAQGMASETSSLAITIQASRTATNVVRCPWEKGESSIRLPQ